MFSTLKKLPGWVKQVPAKIRLCRRVIRAPYFKWVPPGHFYSPVPDMADVAARSSTIFRPPPDTLPGIDLRGEKQV